MRYFLVILFLNIAILMACNQGPAGSWLYSGPECPDGYSNCSGARTTNPKLMLLANNEPRGAGIMFQCEDDEIAVRYYSGAGTSLEGGGIAVIDVVVGQFGQNYNASEVAGATATFREPTADFIASTLSDADSTDSKVGVVITGAGNQRYSASFDVEGMAENMERLPCFR